jgi:hypothetical protein
MIWENPKWGIYVHNLTEQTIQNKSELMGIIWQGATIRSTNATTMNDTSSWSHAILQIFIETWYVEQQQ